MLLISILLAFFLDMTIKELPARFHPLVFFGRLVNFLEELLNRDKIFFNNLNFNKKLLGFLAAFLAIVPITCFLFCVNRELQTQPVVSVLFSACIFYIAIGYTSLQQHAQAVIQPLRESKLEVARQAVAMIVSRDTKHMDEQEVTKAATESVLENGADAIFSPLFWFVIAGVPGVVLYRLSNTLDAMWGYRNDRYKDFGFFSAKLDDVLNFIPARLTALSYALLGNTKDAIQCWRQQAPLCASPNAGPVMAAGAGALGVMLGGTASYHGKFVQKPELGLLRKSYANKIEMIEKACQLVSRTLCLWLVVITIVHTIMWIFA